ncbi:DNA topoisomerase [Sulfurimonas indica]|uniref:DNA topoisomerase n=1 Tax=Sulfurimonas TaxID=202746 RepID=UPI00165F8D0D|nr:DNA topoisomerase [Sulfurimonas indica]
MQEQVNKIIKEKLFSGVKKYIILQQKEKYCNTQEYILSSNKHEVLNKKYKEWYKEISNFYLSYHSIFALHFLVKRELQIEKFEAQEIIKVEASYEYDGIEFTASYPARYTIDMQKEIEDCIVELENKDCAHIVDNFKVNKSAEKSPHPPLTNAQLKYSCFYLFQFSPSYTTKLAEFLYDCGLITSIDTNGWNIEESVVEEMITVLNSVYSQERVLQSRRVFIDKKIDRSKECIRPVKFLKNYFPKNIEKTMEFNSISFESAAQKNDIKKLYELIFYTTLATQMKNSIYDASSVEIVAGNRKLVNQSNIVLDGFENWELLTGEMVKRIAYNSDSYFGQTVVLPDLEPGTELVPISVYTKPFTSKRPPRYGIGRFITQILEKHGIGGNSYDAIVEEIVDSKAALNIKRMLYPQQSSIILFEFFEKFLPSFMNLEYMYEIDEKIIRAKEGEIKIESVISELDEMITEAFDNANISIDTKPSDAKINLLRKVIIKHGLKINIDDYKNSETKIDLLLANYEPEEFKKVGKCPKCNFSVLQKEYVNTETGECTKYYVCEKYNKKSGCNFAIWDNYIYRFFSSKEMELFTEEDRLDVFKKILPLKRGYFFTGFVAKNKNVYDAKVFLSEYKDKKTGAMKWGFQMKFQKGKK